MIVLLVMLYGCTKPFTMENNGQTVELQIDSPFEVELTGNPSTGYSWKLAEADKSVIKMTGEPEFTQSDDRIGSPGTYTFSFQTIAAGETEIVLVYSRVFESDEPPAKTFRMTIISGTMGRITAE